MSREVKHQAPGFFWVKIMTLNLWSFPDVQALCWCLLYYLVTLKGISQRGDWSWVLDFASKVLHWHALDWLPTDLSLGISPARFTKVEQSLVCLPQQQIWPLASVRSIFSLNATLSLYLHSFLCVFTTSSFLCPPLGSQTLGSRAVFHIVLRAASCTLWSANKSFSQK